MYKKNKKNSYKFFFLHNINMLGLSLDDLKLIAEILSLDDLKLIAKIRGINPNKDGLFQGSFSCGGGRVNLTPPSYYKKNLSNINITLYKC